MLSPLKPNAFTWTCTVAEALIGLWLVSYMGWPVLGGVVIGLAMGGQLARIMAPIAKELGYE